MSDDGPQAMQIRFLMDTKAQLNNLPDPLWAEVRGTINSKLNSHFARHPGYNVGRPNTYYNGAYRTQGWNVSEGWTEAAFFPDPDAASWAIRGVGLTVADDQVVRLRVLRELMAVDGTLTGVSAWVSKGLDNGAGIERQVVLPAGYVATGVLVRANEDGVTHLGVRGRRLIAQPGAVLVNETVVWANGQSTVPETEFTVPSGHLLTGLGLRMNDGNLTVHAYRAELPRGFTTEIGGGGGSLRSIDAGNGRKVIGILAGTEGSGATESIGFFGLVSAHDADVAAGMDPAEAAASVMYTTYFDEDRQQLRNGGAASYALVENGAIGPDNMQARFCPPGESIERVAVYGDHMVRKISWFTCTGGSFVSANIGTARGSYMHLACDADPVTGEGRNLAVNGLRARNGWRLDALQFHCGPN